MRPPSRGAERRRGGALIELALVCPIAVTLITGTLALGLEVFRYQQLETLAREAARWASVRGPGSVQKRGEPPPTAEVLFDDFLASRLVGLDPGALTCDIQFLSGGEEGGGVVLVELHYRRSPEGALSPVVIRRSASAPITY